MEKSYQNTMRRTTRAALACAVIGGMLLALPFGARAEKPTPVTVENTPLEVSVVKARTPFAKLLCASSLAGDCTVAVGNTRSPALPASFIVPAATEWGKPIRQLTIEFVSGDCVGTARTTQVFLEAASPGSPTLADTGDNFSVNKIPVALAQFNTILGANAVQSFAQRTQLVYLPGMTVSTTFDFTAAGAMRCAVQLNGYFLTD